MLNLCLHCGASKVERDEVSQVHTPVATSSHVPIPHDVLIDLTAGVLEEAGMSVVQQAHSLSHGGERYFGLMEMESAGGDHTLVMGLRNSHDMSFSAGLVCGSGVFVCDNLCFSGEVRLARKHTRFIRRDLPALVYRGVAQLADQRDYQERRLAAYRQTGLTDVNAHDLIVRAVDAQVIPPSRIIRVLEEWRDPSHAEFEEQTVWRLFNSFTESFKGGNVATLPRRGQSLHGLLDSHCGVSL